MLERDTIQFIALIVLLLIVITYLAIVNNNLRKTITTLFAKMQSSQNNSNLSANQQTISPKTTSPLVLQAIERLTILAERIALPNLIQRNPPGVLNTQQYKELLIAQIVGEFDYNLSQQIYVSTTAWQAVTNLKDQNIFIINQIADTIGNNASGIQAYNAIVDLLKANPQSSLHPVVVEVLRHEAQQML
jgi:hypothetical protein